MCKKFVLSLMLCNLPVILLSAISLSQAAVLSVGPGDSIPSAIHAANQGDVIEVMSGTYYDHLKIDKSITLRGLAMPVIDATASGSAITVIADGVRIEGFRIINSGSLQGIMPSIMRDGVEAGIKVLSKNDIITGNNVSNNFNGIYILHSSNSTIFDNIVKDNLGFGIRLEESRNNTIYGNSFVDNYGQNAYDDGTNFWDNGSMGNYYSDFVCNNKEGGICSTVYSVPGGKSIDRYPMFRILQ